MSNLDNKQKSTFFGDDVKFWLGRVVSYMHKKNKQMEPHHGGGDIKLEYLVPMLMMKLQIVMLYMQLV